MNRLSSSSWHCLVVVSCLFASAWACSARPDYTMLVYTGGMVERGASQLQGHVVIPGDVPPMFLVHAFDDNVTVLNSLLLASAVKQAGGSAELHVYATGGHGYGLRPTDDAVTRWPKHAAQWLGALGVLSADD